MKSIRILTALLAALSLCAAAQESDTALSPTELEQSLRGSIAARKLSPDGTAQLLDLDVIKIIEFVRSEIAYQQYPGILRGGIGTLSDGAGNSFDQALLLQRMLRNARVDAELWRGVLSEEWAAKLRRRALNNGSGWNPNPQEMSTDPRVSKEIARLLEQWREANGKLLPAARRVSEALPPAMQAAVEAGESVQGPMDYMWVRIRREEGFVDIHPAFAEDEAVEVREIAYAEVQTSLPSELYHAVRLRLVAERLAADDFGREVVLERLLVPMAMTGSTARIYLNPTQSGDRLMITPVMQVGDSMLTGEQRSYPYNSENTPIGGITALYLEVTVLSPGAGARQQSITMADVLKVGDWQNRNAGELAAAVPLALADFRASCDVLVMGGAVHPVFQFIATAQTVRRLERASNLNDFDATAVRFSLPFEENLLEWATRYSLALKEEMKSGWLDSPAVVVALSRIGSSAAEALTGYYLLHLNLAGAEGAEPGVFAALLLEDIVGTEAGAALPEQSDRWQMLEKQDAEALENPEILLELQRGSVVARAVDSPWWLSLPRRANQPLAARVGRAVSEKKTGLDAGFQSHFPHVLLFPAGKLEREESQWKEWLRDLVRERYLTNETFLTAWLPIELQ